jgi:hypothetical protein
VYFEIGTAMDDKHGAHVPREDMGIFEAPIPGIAI